MNFILAKIGVHRGGKKGGYTPLTRWSVLDGHWFEMGRELPRVQWVHDVSDLSTRYEGCGSGCRVCPLSFPLTVWAERPKLPTLARLDVSLDTWHLAMYMNGAVPLRSRP